jgi:hypothetical protein
LGRKKEGKDDAKEKEKKDEWKRAGQKCRGVS